MMNWIGLDELASLQVIWLRYSSC